MPIKSLIRHYWTDAEKAKIVADFKASGLSQGDFAARHKIAPSNIQRWVRQSQIPDPSPAPAALVELPNLLPATANPGAYRLHLPQGLSLELTRGFVPEEVRVLVQLLQSL